MRNFGTLAMTLVVAAFTLSFASPVTAHDRVQPHQLTHGGFRHFHRHHHAGWPRWLRTHRDFHRWYRIRYHGLAPRLRWQRLYHLYRHDRLYHHRLKHDRRYRHRRRH